MRLSMLPIMAASVAVPALGLRVNLTYSTVYDQKTRPLREVACWNPNVPGLFPGGDDWLLQQNVAPGILAIPSITGWDHPDCISCWSVTWEEGDRTRMLLAIDRSEEGFVTSHERMSSLTNGQADDISSLEPLEVIARRVSLENCGFPPPNGMRKETSDEL
ncbi:hypothetical protein LZ32DRAFT_650724 [Colletotrichum eremochloae]|nr:hypothetical protein LZ32DRAFT_650724 [Colletotrichum eremochloae]